MTSIPHAQALELYHYPESLCSRMAPIALPGKGHDWKRGAQRCPKTKSR